jgi:hypothetical protein
MNNSETRPEKIFFHAIILHSHFFEKNLHGFFRPEFPEKIMVRPAFFSENPENILKKIFPGMHRFFHPDGTHPGPTKRKTLPA